ncbi:hypothetical protein PVAP13_6NG244612, partial [Panicum virgatum]
LRARTRSPRPPGLAARPRATGRRPPRPQKMGWVGWLDWMTSYQAGFYLDPRAVTVRTTDAAAGGRGVGIRRRTWKAREQADVCHGFRRVRKPWQTGNTRSLWSVEQL